MEKKIKDHLVFSFLYSVFRVIPICSVEYLTFKEYKLLEHMVLDTAVSTYIHMKQLDSNS